MGWEKSGVVVVVGIKFEARMGGGRFASKFFQKIDDDVRINNALITSLSLHDNELIIVFAETVKLGGAG